jgi:sucrose-6-phosphate hydrolase SacC (GH32 family)
MGVYDPVKQTYTNVSRPILLDAGGGVDYGSLSWTDDPAAEQRCLFVSWLRLTEASPPDCGTQGQLTLIRDLRYDPRLDTLVHSPIVEYQRLRSERPLFDDSTLRLPAGAPAITLFAPSARGGATGISMDVEFNVSVPSALGAASATLSVRCKSLPQCEGGANLTLSIGALKPDGRRDVVLDVRYKYHFTVRFVMLSGEVSLPLRVLSDTRSLEIFVANGRGAASVTMLSTGGAVAAAASGSDLTVAASAWQLGL